MNLLRWIGTIGGASFAIPAIAALLYRVRSPSQRIIGAYCALGFVQSISLSMLAARGTHNLWLLHLFVPLQGTMFLWALALWQTRERARITVFMAIPLFLVAWLALTLTVESFDAFPRYVKIIEGLLVIAVAAYTLVARSQYITEPVTSYAWFWVSAALVMYLSFGAILSPISSLLLPLAPERVIVMIRVNGVLLIICNLLFARAMASGRSGAGASDALHRSAAT
ncbi:MAG TPA: hypothetical protein VFT04_04250 [Gemmatimonadales bacterium]|nr:hypothetical protein [Gemmatimonadales bacterium]